MKKKVLWLIIGMLVWSACSSVATSVPAAPTETPEVSDPLTSPLESPVEAPPSSEAKIAAMLKPDVAEALNLSPEELRLVSVKSVEWSDASLGCPQPGEVYAQVITPGWQLIFEDEASNRYDVRAPKAATTFVICEDRDTLPAPTEAAEAPTGVIAAAKRIVMEQAGVDEALLTLVSVESVQWRNSCLGCAGPDEACAMVITPGYRVVLRAGDALYEVHTDQDGDSARLCEGAGGGSTLPSESENVPDRIWILHDEVLAFLGADYPGFGLEMLSSSWRVENVTEPGKLGVSHYRFTNLAWELAYACPVVATPQCEVDLRHREAGRLWQGTIHSEEGVREASAPPTLTYEVGECDESLTGEVLDAWAGVVVTPTANGFNFVHRIAYNCCADIIASLGQDIETKMLRLVETNRGEVCRCMCGYEMTGSVTDRLVDDYTVEFWGVQKPNMHPLEQLASTEISMSSE